MKQALLTIGFIFISIVVFSQKMPNIQEAAMKAPGDVKIDGISKEWSKKLQAHNRATGLNYTLANDVNNLYLVIQINDPVIINKVISAGITLSIKKNGNLNDVQSITYPYFDVNNKPQIDVKNTPKIDSSKASKIKADSFMTANNQKLFEKSRWIKVSGIKELDTLMSVYNREGIKAAQRFDNQMNYTIELSIQLRHLGFSANTADKFEYKVTSNGATMMSLNGISFDTPKPGTNARKVLTIGPGAMPPSTLPIMMSTTDFKGVYTLVK
ncbi:hypothetical protein DYU05_00020 [Mucilaginibacter terrenus]|uniref:Uncharacterized protein n=1 Tax=Mucilaginibacter terrenus TaxID=2482727 RepID=A0A3E2NSS1_9SPHI|nr:hypothetical protein [Mucilaginibacter terrenus]RFZ84063.1 hypothetical protein DYU05_00020 [Mucilaginibacter terrenus]